ncbi:MAG: HNH endonuclease [Verrucomicrobiales bacterium]
MCIFQEHMEEANGIPTEEESRRKLSKRLRRLIENLYGRKCFGCGAAEDLHMDHIIPQSRGGTSAFRNLQPLCERCGQEKGDSMPEVIEAMSLVYFEPGPPDAGEALFC